MKMEDENNIKRKLRIGIDIDEVLAEQVVSLVKFYNKEKGKSFSRDDFFSYYWPDVLGCTLEEAVDLDNRFKESEDFDNLDAVNGSKEAIKNLSFHDLIVITSRPTKFESKTMNWLDTHFNNLFDDVLHSSDFHTGNGLNKTKGEICKELDLDLLIDDQGAYVLDCAKKGIKAILLDAPWNQDCPEHKNIIRVKDWHEIVERINNYSEGEYFASTKHKEIEDGLH